MNARPRLFLPVFASFEVCCESASRCGSKANSSTPAVLADGATCMDKPGYKKAMSHRMDLLENTWLAVSTIVLKNVGYFDYLLLNINLLFDNFSLYKLKKNYTDDQVISFCRLEIFSRDGTLFYVHNNI